MYRRDYWMLRKRYCYVALFTGSILYLYYLHNHLTHREKVINVVHPIRTMMHNHNYSRDKLCGNESFVYSHLVSDGTEVKFIEGKKFDCASGMPYLKKFGLLSNQTLQSSPVDPKNVVFAIAADSNYYESSRAVIAAIKKHFGEEARIIFYDLGRILDNEKYKAEMSSICNFEIRIFNWSILPNDVRGARIFAWKIMIVAELFKEFDTFFYLDSSIFFETGDFSPFYDMINNESLTPFQMSGSTGHSIRHATNKKMYKYIPIDMTIPRMHDMLEANMMLIHRSEATRKLIKWSVLCAVTRDCIEPPESSLACPHETANTPEGICHRQDQSVFNILLANLEQQWINEGRSLISHIMPNHPKNSKQRHQTRRMQSTDEKINNCPK